LRFIWDYDNITHIAEHGLSPEEVEHALNDVTMPVEYQDWHAEDRFADVGMTASGRILLILTTWRDDDVRIVTAFDPPKRLIREYLEKR
jgi:uncharacterized DUF497 family protein